MERGQKRCCKGMKWREKKEDATQRARDRKRIQGGIMRRREGRQRYNVGKKGSDLFSNSPSL